MVSSDPPYLALPERVADHYHVLSPGHIVGSRQCAPKDRMDAEHVEVSTGYQRTVNVAGATVLDRDPCDGAIRGDACTTLEQLTCLSDRFDVGTAERVMGETRRA